MPGVLDLKCDNDHRWQAIESISVVDPSVKECPECGSREVSKIFAGGTFGIHGDGRDVRPEDLDPETRDFLLENKAHIEANSDKVLSGEYSIRERGPDFARPKMPEHLKKKYF